MAKKPTSNRPGSKFAKVKETIKSGARNSEKTFSPNSDVSMKQRVGGYVFSKAEAATFGKLGSAGKIMSAMLHNAANRKPDKGASDSQTTMPNTETSQSATPIKGDSIVSAINSMNKQTVTAINRVNTNLLLTQQNNLKILREQTTSLKKMTAYGEDSAIQLREIYGLLDKMSFDKGPKPSVIKQEAAKDPGPKNNGILDTIGNVLSGAVKNGLGTAITSAAVAAAFRNTLLPIATTLTTRASLLTAAVYATFKALDSIPHAGYQSAQKNNPEMLLQMDAQRREEQRLFPGGFEGRWHRPTLGLAPSPIYNDGIDPEKTDSIKPNNVVKSLQHPISKRRDNKWKNVNRYEGRDVSRKPAASMVDGQNIGAYTADVEDSHSFGMTDLSTSESSLREKEATLENAVKRDSTSIINIEANQVNYKADRITFDSNNLEFKIGNQPGSNTLGSNTASTTSNSTSTNTNSTNNNSSNPNSTDATKVDPSKPALTDAQKSSISDLEKNGTLTTPMGKDDPFKNYSEKQLADMGIKTSHIGKTNAKMYSYEKPKVDPNDASQKKVWDDKLSENEKVAILKRDLKKNFPDATDAQISAIAGNLKGEGGLKSGQEEIGRPLGDDSGIGHMQWTRTRRHDLEKFAASRNKPWSDHQTQMDFMKAEAEGKIGTEKAAYDKFFEETKNMNADDAASHFMRTVERPSDAAAAQSDPKRRKWADKYSKIDAAKDGPLSLQDKFNKVSPDLLPKDAANTDKSGLLNEGLVEEKQSVLAGIRKKPIQDDVKAALEYVAAKNNVTPEIFSGGQDKKGLGTLRTGSTRHDDGNAADMKFKVKNADGTTRYLNMNNEADLAVLKNIAKDAASVNMTGLGMDNDYMGPESMHIGKGDPLVWGKDGKSANAPQWLRDSFEEGRKNPVDLKAWQEERRKAKEAEVVKQENEKKALEKPVATPVEQPKEDATKVNDNGNNRASQRGEVVTPEKKPMPSFEELNRKNSNPNNTDSISDPMATQQTAQAITPLTQALTQSISPLVASIQSLTQPMSQMKDVVGSMLGSMSQQTSLASATPTPAASSDISQNINTTIQNDTSGGQMQNPSQPLPAIDDMFGQLFQTQMA